MAIVATGQSFTAAHARLIGMARAKDLIRVIAVNDAVYACGFADIAYACDGKWWRYHRGLPGFPGRKLKLKVPHEETGEDLHPPGHPGIDTITSSGTEGFDPDPAFLRSGGSSGYQALHLAIHLQCDPIVLVAFDMHGKHWFGDHPAEIRGSPDLSNRIRRFAALAEVTAARNIRVVNATPGSKLGYFPIVSLENELANLEAGHERQRQRAARKGKGEAADAAEAAN